MSVRRRKYRTSTSRAGALAPLPGPWIDYRWNRTTLPPLSTIDRDEVGERDLVVVQRLLDDRLRCIASPPVVAWDSHGVVAGLACSAERLDRG